MNLFPFIAITLITLIGLIVYRLIAFKYDLLDHPNERSSHNIATYRGAGIIFLVGYLGSLFFLHEQDWKLTLSVFLATAVGFWDDFKGLNAGMRALLYLTALLLALYSIPGFHHMPLAYAAITVIVGLGTINAYNFMDGINGISILYFLTMLGTVWFIFGKEAWMSVDLLIGLLIPSLIFVLLNVRKHAIAFMGDAGSVALGLISVFLVVLIIWKTREAAWLLLFLVYGVDSVLTIAERLIRKENIFKAHRRHLYQLLSNELGWSHVAVSVIYALLQALVNFLLYSALQKDWTTISILLLFAAVLGIIYVAVKGYLIKKLKNQVYA